MKGRAMAVAEARGAAAVREAVGRIDAAARAIDGVRVTRAEDGVVLSGRGLRVRALAEPELRGLAEAGR